MSRLHVSQIIRLIFLLAKSWTELRVQASCIIIKKTKDTVLQSYIAIMLELTFVARIASRLPSIDAS